VLIPLDGSPRAEGILKLATDLGSLAEAEYTLVRIVRPVPLVGLDLFGYATGGLDLAQGAKLEAEARAYLDGVAARLRSRSLRVQTTVVVHDHPAAGILDTALAQGADLIALATRGRGGLKRLLLGSVADKVMRGASTPVLLYRPLD
jgi:nucleotide-binding universal stress UspA family protein